MAQVVAHILGKDEVTSSSLVISSRENLLVERFLRIRKNRFCYFLFKIHFSHKFVGVIQPISATRGVNKRKAFLLNPAVRLTS